MSGEEIEKILRFSGIRPTPVRILVMKLLQDASHPMSSVEIETALQTVDRSSITRTLASFCDNRLIHQIQDGSGSMRYEICRESKESHHDDVHAHFHCRHCGRTYCLHDISPKMPCLPDGFSGEDISYIISGLCPECRNA